MAGKVGRVEMNRYEKRIEQLYGDERARPLLARSDYLFALGLHALDVNDPPRRHPVWRWLVRESARLDTQVNAILNADQEDK